MTAFHLILRGLRHHGRTHLGVAAGAGIGAAVLVGALAVGDSVRHSLRAMALQRLGGVQHALEAPDRTFHDALADKLAGGGTRTAAVLSLSGLAASGDGGGRVPGVRIYGVDGRFGVLVGAAAVPPAADPDAVVLNEPLARRLGVKVGGTVLLRVERPGLLPRDAPLSGAEDATEAVRLTVAAVAPDDAGGRFSLRAEQAAPYNAFVHRHRLQALVGLTDRSNLLLAGGGESGPASLDGVLRARWGPADAGLEVRELPGRGVLEVRSPRVFLEAPLVDALAGVPGAQGVLTYFVNELRVGDRSTPYSMVSAVGDLGDGRGRPIGPASSPAPDRPWGFLAGGEIAINDWLAKDLQAEAGDTLAMAYFVPAAGRALEERTARFRVASVVPMSGIAADRELLPDYPGLSDVENCRDWKPGIPIDLDRIRKQDEAYWKEHRGTPKAFIALPEAQALWANRFGSLTAVRFPLRPGIRGEIEEAFRRRLAPAGLGLYFHPVREEALAAAAQAQDFGGLFLGFSFFLIAAALLLTGLLFTLGVEQRAEEAGILLATGFTLARVRGLFLVEGGLLALAGSLAGTLGGLVYARGVLAGLATVWRPAVGTSALHFHAEPATLALGAAAGFVLALVSIGWAVRRLAKRPARELLAGGAYALAVAPAGRSWGFWPAGVAAVAALAWVILAAGRRPGTGAGAFFGAGSLLLVSGLFASRALLAVLSRRAATGLTTAGLALRNAARRRGRSLAVVALLACGTFLVAAVGANRRGGGADVSDRTSGTGGFALWATASIPVFHDLNRPDGRAALGLDPKDMEGVTVVPIRVRDGDDASCLNLNRAPRPRILGVQPDVLAGRFAFVRQTESGGGWTLLDGPVAGEAAIADDATATWALGSKTVGDAVPAVDERGRPFDLRLVGLLGDSILQGNLVVSEAAFLRRFPSASGARAFLIDVPPGRVGAVAAVLQRALQDYGFEAVPADQRLAAFHAVENTYLAVFLALGGLGLVLGSLGLGVVVMRNVLERRAELAILRAVGFEARAVRRLVVVEHAMMLALGLACGAAAAAVAVIPALSGASAPVVSVAGVLAAVAASGVVWTFWAAGWALRGPLLAALRDD